MHHKLRRIDLNLLLVFEALYRHRSVVLAADELAMSPSACSHALSRLRSAFSDELFLRYGSAMQPTAHAEQLAIPIADALQLLSGRLVDAGPFVPASSTESFIFAASDFTAFALLPSLVERIESRAPHLRIKVLHAAHRDALDDLAAGRANFVAGIADEYSSPAEGIESIEGSAEEYVVVHRKAHPRIGRALTLDQYLQERHVAVIPWTDAGSVIDTALASQGLQRDVAVELPGMMAAPFIIASSDYLMTLPKRVALKMGAAAALVMHPTPFAAPDFRLSVLYHARQAGLPGHRWMREQIALALRAKAR